MDERRRAEARSREAGCAGKVPYRSRIDAIKALYRIRAGRKVMRSYRCRHCGRWHIGHTSSREATIHLLRRGAR